jgi:leucyl/phenylalanyl-tRNA--protein transferase
VIDADIVAVGGDLEPDTLLEAYRNALFPMPLQPTGVLAWWSPDPRGIILPKDFHVSRTLRRSCRRFEVRVDTAFAAVIDACADPARPHGWITPEIRDAYVRLHELGWAHSVETWQHDCLVGGVYGVAIGGLFAGESMFHRRSDASKVALARVASLLTDEAPQSQAGGASDTRLLDVQWLTPHLARLGAGEIPRRHYLGLLERALRLPLPSAFARGTM